MNILFDLENVVIDWDITKVIRSLNLTAEKKKIIRQELFEHTDW